MGCIPEFGKSSPHKVCIRGFKQSWCNPPKVLLRPFLDKFHVIDSYEDIESERRCQVDMSIKMIQSRARCRLVCSLPAYCVKLLTATLRTVWVTRQESKQPVYNMCNTSCSALFWGFVVSNITYKPQTDISNSLGDITLNCK